VLVLAAFCHWSCAGTPGSDSSTGIIDPTERISVVLASVLPPQEAGWHYSREHPGRVTIGKIGELPGQSFSGMVVLSSLPPMQSQEEFLQLVSSQRARDSGDPRYEDLLSEESVSNENGIWVVRFHTRYKDFGARNSPPSAGYLVIEDVGAVFRHPVEMGVAITVALSQRSMPEDALIDFAARAESFIDSIEFQSERNE
jgi:hypothetical protein